MDEPMMEFPEGDAGPAKAGNDAVSKKDHFLPVSIVIAAVIIGGSVLFATLYKPGTTPQTAVIGATASSTAPAAPALPALTARDVILGNANAPVTVVEYGDYQCPFCTRYYENIQPLIVQNYVNTGKVKFVFRDFPFLDQSQISASNVGESHAAGIAAECAKDQNQFWAYHNALYAAKAADEAKGGGENDGLFTRALFLQIAGQLKMDTTALASCLDSGKYTATVAGDYTAAANAGVNSTPTTFVNGKEVVDASGYSVGADQNAILQAITAALQG